MPTINSPLQFTAAARAVACDALALQLDNATLNHVTPPSPCSPTNRTNHFMKPSARSVAGDARRDNPRLGPPGLAGLRRAFSPEGGGLRNTFLSVVQWVGRG